MRLSPVSARLNNGDTLWQPWYDLLASTINTRSILYSAESDKLHAEVRRLGEKRSRVKPDLGKTTMENNKNINKMEALHVSSENYKNGSNNVCSNCWSSCTTALLVYSVLCLQKLRFLKFNSERKFQIANNKIKSKTNSRQAEQKRPKMQTLHLWRNYRNKV